MLVGCALSAWVVIVLPMSIDTDVVGPSAAEPSRLGAGAVGAAVIATAACGGDEPEADEDRGQ
ncbi:MAG: hypothetical protein R2755_17255 [Acidimicrobiales bacterium]